jgi:hypothetical protein
VSGDELNSDGDDDENDKMSLSNDSDLPDPFQVTNSDDEDEIDSFSDSDEGLCVLKITKAYCRLSFQLRNI